MKNIKVGFAVIVGGLLPTTTVNLTLCFVILVMSGCVSIVQIHNTRTVKIKQRKERVIMPDPKDLNTGYRGGAPVVTNAIMS